MCCVPARGIIARGHFAVHRSGVALAQKATVELAMFLFISRWVFSCLHSASQDGDCSVDRTYWRREKRRRLRSCLLQHGGGYFMGPALTSQGCIQVFESILFLSMVGMTPRRRGFDMASKLPADVGSDDSITAVLRDNLWAGRDRDVRFASDVAMARPPPQGFLESGSTRFADKINRNCVDGPDPRGKIVLLSAN